MSEYEDMKAFLAYDGELDIPKLVKEMIDYCKERENYSYYELAAYAKRHRRDWDAVLRKKNPRQFIAYYLRDARSACKKAGIKQPTMEESLKRIKDI